MLSAPVILPQRYDTVGTRLHIDPNTFVEIRCELPYARIYFTVDGTRPGPFQIGRTGKSSTIKYVGPFRLQLGHRVVKAIAVSRDKLRESPVSTRYINVVPEFLTSDEGTDYEEPELAVIHHHGPPVPVRVSEFQQTFNRPESRQSMNSSHRPQNELQGSIEGPINPVNYSGTQINIWGIPPPDLVSLIDPTRGGPQANLGPMTEDMINRLKTPRYPIDTNQKNLEIEYKPNQSKEFQAFMKQLEDMYEDDGDFRYRLDTILQLSSLDSGSIVERNDSFLVSLKMKKYYPTQSEPEQIRAAPPPPPPQPKPKPVRQVSIERKGEPLQPKPKPFIPVPQSPTKKQEPVIYREDLQEDGTLVPAPNFSPEYDCEALKYAMKGLGTKEDILISIMGNRSNSQRIQIRDMYKTMFGKDLDEAFKSETSGNFKKLLVALLQTPVEYDCTEIRKAVQGLGTDDSVLIEILTSRSNTRLKDISVLYQKLFKRKVEDDIKSDTSGYYRKLLVSLLSAGRPETSEVSLQNVQKDVDDLIAAGIKKWGTDESRFNVIFGTRSYSHLRALFEEYRKRAGKSIEDSIKSEMSGNLAKTYLSLIVNIRSRPAYFAKEIKKAIKGMGTDEHTLNRIFVSRCEIDMKQIKHEYERAYNVSLEKDVLDDVSGDYGKLLLMLAKDPTQRIYDPVSIDKSNIVVPTGPHVYEEVTEPVVEETPTLRESSGFAVQNDCEQLRKAMKGLGTDEKAIIDIVCKRSLAQRLQIKNTYTQMFGKDLVKELHGELSGHFRDTILGLLMSPGEFDAWCYHKAIKGLGTDDSAIIELLTTRSSEQINAAKQEYEKLYKKPLEKHVSEDTSGDYRKVLISLLTANRPTGNRIDRTQSQADAQNLINCGIKKLGTEESRFIVVLCSRSYAQLRATFDEYQKLSGKKLEDDIRSEFSFELKNVFLSIIGCIRDKQAHFANLLYNSMKGLGTKDDCVVRIIVNRCEIDMVQIKAKFQELHNASLVDFLKGDLSGDYLRSMLTLIGEDGSIK